MSLCLHSESAQIIKAISKNDFLKRLDEEQINMMVELMTVLDCAPGDDVITEGTEGDSMYIVAGVYACVRVIRESVSLCIYKIYRGS